MSKTKALPKKVEEKDERNVPLELLNELYRSYDFFNKHYCEGKLPRPMIIVSSNFNKKAHGWFGPGSWKLKGKAVSEITLCGESFERGYEDVLGTLIHEMAHLKNYYDNDCKVVDCTDQQRHNKIFKVTAEFFGLVVTSSQRFGPAHTSLGEVAHKAVDALKPNKELYTLYREMKSRDEKKKKEAKLKPVMIDKETKKTIEEGAKAMGITQKEFTQKAANLLVKLDERITTVALAIFENRKHFKTVEEIAELLKSGLNEPTEQIQSQGE